MEDMAKSARVCGYRFIDLVTIKTVQDLVNRFHALTKRSIAVFGVEGTILVNSPGQRLCLDFHRKNPLSSKLCRESDLAITRLLDRQKGGVIQRCKHSLIDFAAPVVVEGKHIANVFGGQFFTERPDIEFFKERAGRFGFDELDYLEAVREVPVYKKSSIKAILEYLRGIRQSPVRSGPGADARVEESSCLAGE